MKKPAPLGCPAVEAGLAFRRDSRLFYRLDVFILTADVHCANAPFVFGILQRAFGQFENPPFDRFQQPRWACDEGPQIGIHRGVGFPGLGPPNLRFKPKKPPCRLAPRLPSVGFRDSRNWEQSHAVSAEFAKRNSLADCADT